MNVRVHYPLASGALALRDERDWERSIAPVRVSRDRTRFDFELGQDAAYRYFKPVLEDQGRLAWSQGDNYLALRERRAAKVVYPHFAPDASCHVCTAHSIPSSFEERGYEVRVFLPRGYDENSLQRFPVLYMQDGHNLFFPEQAPEGKSWRVAETLALLDSMCLIRQVIVVGIVPGDRMQEYTQPGYERYGRFVVEELKPWVDAHYRTLRGAQDTGVLGSSLGGVVSFYLGWQYPRVFGCAGALSSTFGYRDDLCERVLAEPRRALRLYLDSGWPSDNYETTRSLATALAVRGHREGSDFVYLAFPDGRHDERSWAARVHLPFQFFFRE